MLFKYEPMMKLGEKDAPVPDFRNAYIEVECRSCHDVTRIPIAHTMADYEKAYEKMRELVRKQNEGFDNIINEFQDLYPDVPLKEFIQGKIDALKWQLNQWLKENK